MLAVDTNVVVRLLTNDDPAQARRAAAFFADHEIFIAVTVLLETEWVLRHAYDLERSAILRGLRGVLGLPQVRPEDPPRIAIALDWYERGLDFGDALHLAASRHVERFVTFDLKLARRAKALAAPEVVVA